LPKAILCVSRSILTACSTVFQAMFEFSQPAKDGEESVDGKPVIRLHDNAAEVGSFLCAIFDTEYLISHTFPVQAI
jgi:hypothetical protein